VHDAAEREIFVMPALEIAEDIHRPTIEAAVSWEWETFADYMQVVRRLPKGVNFGAMAGHGTLRSYVMGDRAFDRGGATEDDVAAIARQLDLAMGAGAMGFSSILPGASMWEYYRDLEPRESDPRVVCGLATPQEVEAITEVLGRHRRGSVQLGGAD
jgi:N-acyl-D-aspartate/D-glutamate deacylase